MSVTSSLRIKTTEMHSGGEAVRIVEEGYPRLHGNTLLEKRRYATECVDHVRKFLMWEPRGHFDMYGAILVPPDMPQADLAVLFIHNEGYSTMCGHATIALGRYAVERGLIPTHRLTIPEVKVNIQCPCGLVQVFVSNDGKKTGRVRFLSVPSFAFLLDGTIQMEVKGEPRRVTFDIGYGGAFYAIVVAKEIGVDLDTSPTRDIVEAATRVSNAVKSNFKLYHPDNEDLAFLYGTIVTDGLDKFDPSVPTSNLTVFADREVDRAPTGSGVTTRIAVQMAKGLIQLNKTRSFKSSATKAEYTGRAVDVTKVGKFDAVVVEVAGDAYFTGRAEFTAEDEDQLRNGFLLK